MAGDSWFMQPQPPPSRGPSHSRTRASESGTASGRSRTKSATENAAVLAPTPSAVTRMAVSAKPRARFERAGGVAQILLQDVPVDGRCIHDDLVKQPRIHSASRARPLASRRADTEDGGHLLAVVRAERGGIQVQKQPVEPHQAFRGARPLARASASICASRRASAMATARPNGVIR